VSFVRYVVLVVVLSPSLEAYWPVSVLVIDDVPDVPEEPEVPDVPDKPEVPEEPDVPELPLVPDVPDKPDVPEEPEVPLEPEVPDVPELPELPLVPEEPDEPELPDVPELPELPEEPLVPEEPDVPDEPLEPVVQNHLEEFVRYLKWILIARNEFNRFKIANPETLTDIQWAVRFYCLLKMAYNSKIPNQFFRVSKKRQQSLNLLRIEEELSAVHRRLARVYIENMHYADLIRRFDGPETFFYVAPPYYGLEDYYGKDIFHREDFGILRDLLTTINGKFIMSINDTPEIRELFKGFNVSTAATNYKSIGKIKRVSELLITNYEPAASTRTCGLF